jgi:hypothetical protein
MTGRVCIFCGSAGVTNEDLIPRWTFNVLRQLPQYLDAGITRDTTKNKSDESGKWETSIIRHGRLRRTCPKEELGLPAARATTVG